MGSFPRGNEGRHGAWAELAGGCDFSREKCFFMVGMQDFASGRKSSGARRGGLPGRGSFHVKTFSHENLIHNGSVFPEFPRGNFFVDKRA